MPEMTRLVTWEWSLAKEGSAEGENDDAFRVERIPQEGGTETLLIAVADGATEAVYSGRWARVLVEAAEEDWPAIGADLEARVQIVRQSYQPVDPRVETAWYVREKLLTQGSQATLLAAALKPSGTGTFELEAVAIGDSCLVLVRITKEKYIYRAFPLERAEEFRAAPALVSSLSFGFPLKCRHFQSEMLSGDVLMVATDAVAKWMIECLESGRGDVLFDALQRLTSTAPLVPGRPDASAPHISRWRRLLGGSETERSAPKPETRSEALDFAELVRKLRQEDAEPRMRNDDSTLVVCVAIAEGQPVELVRPPLSGGPHTSR